MLKPGEVATALFTYSDQTGAKRRPVLVVSSEEFNTSGNVIIAAISSRPPRDRYDYQIESWKSSGLKMPSKVRAGTLQTITGMLLNKIGTIPDEEYHEVKRLLTEILSLNIN